MTKPLIPQSDVLLDSIRDVLNHSHKHVAQIVNSTMVQTYWQIGHLIVENEQQGLSRAEYGKGTLKALSLSLTKEFGKGFDVTNLRKMRSLFLYFPIRDSLRLELSWTHYRILTRIENNKTRQWYMQESIEQSWSARALERQIGTLYYERLLASQAIIKRLSLF